MNRTRLLTAEQTYNTISNRLNLIDNKIATLALELSCFVSPPFPTCSRFCSAASVFGPTPRCSGAASDKENAKKSARCLREEALEMRQRIGRVLKEITEEHSRVQNYHTERNLNWVDWVDLKLRYFPWMLKGDQEFERLVAAVGKLQAVPKVVVRLVTQAEGLWERGWFFLVYEVGVRDPPEGYGSEHPFGEFATGNS